jgi:conjugal transfer pilus assembly protein TraW
MKKGLLMLCFSFFVQGLEAKDFGTFGETFKIAEPDLVESITSKLKALDAQGDLEKHQLKIQARIKAQLLHPHAVAGLIKTQKARVFYYNPAIKVPTDLQDQQGQVFVKAGTEVNPLAVQSLKQDLIFIAGEDPKQWAWAQKQSAKIILVSGAPFALMEKYPIRLYFDQAGLLVKKLGIHQIPARVSQEAELLKIEELEIPEEGSPVLEEAP